MARRSQCSNAGDNPLDPNYLPPHYREEYRLAIDALLEEDVDGYYQFLQKADVVDFLSRSEIEYIQGSVQIPQQDVGLPELRYMDSGCDGSSDTYWPLHSDTDAPGLDLGWPDLHRFIGPTEVTTLVNPAEPDMPTIKEQARRLIKHAQQVVAVVMDVFTDVDIFADILAAASRNVAVYIILDEQNAHHFINMVLNCRVNLESVQFLRVRTVSGITYRCRSGATFKGQMMDRFLLTDCRAVLSGNYSFMWSFEKLHRCLAHLFLGQLVTTFDEEFRILFAQSQPLIMENALAQMEEFSQLSNRQFISGRTPLYREPKKFLPMNTTRSDNWARPSYDERMDMDWKQMPLSRHESIQRLQEQGPGDMYNRYAPQQLRMDQPYEPGSTRMPINLMESVGFKRHSYAEGSPGRHSPYQFMQHSGMANFDPQGRQFHREQQPYPRAGPEAGYSGCDRFRGQSYHPMDQYPPEPGLPQEMEPPDSFEHVRNYLSSTTNVEMDRASDNLLPPGDASFGSSHPKRLSAGQPYACQTSPTAPNPPDQKQSLHLSSTNRKDPSVKQGLRNWRISSYLSAYDDAGDEDPAVPITMATDPFEEPPNPMQRRSSGPELSAPKIPNTREFKIPAVPRASQLPSYMKLIASEPSKKSPDESVTMEAETKTTPTTPSESSSTTDVEKAEEMEQDEPKDTVVRREESFRRKHNAVVQRNSRLRSSLIFSSQLEQQDSETDASGQPEEETPKTEERPDLPFLSRVLGQRRSVTRAPFEWSRYKKSSTFDSSSTEASKYDDAKNKADTKDSPKEETPKVLPGHSDVKGSSKPAAVEQAQVSPSNPQSQNPDQVVLLKTGQPVNPPTSLLSNPSYVDMNDPDARLRFFKELAAKRKAEKSSEKALVKAPSESTSNTSVEPVLSEVSKNLSDSSDKKPSTTTKALPGKNMTPQKGESETSTEKCGAVGPHQGGTNHMAKSDKQENKPKQKQKSLSTDSEKIENKNSQVSVSSPVSKESPSKPSPESKPLSPVTTEKKNVTPSSYDAHSVTQGHDKKDSKHSNSTVQSSSFQDIPPASSSSLNMPPDYSTKPSTPQALSSSPNILPASSSAPNIPPASSSLPKTASESSSSLNIPSNSCAPHSSVLEPLSSHSTPSDSTCSPPSTTSKHSTPPCPHNSALSLESDKVASNESVNPSSMKSSQMSVHASPETVLMSDFTQGEPSSTTQSTSCKLPSALHSGLVETNVLHSLCANDTESNSASFKSSTETDNKESHTLVQPGAAESLLSPKVAETESNSTTDEVSEESRPSVKPILSPNSVSPCAGSLSPGNLHTVSHPHTLCGAKSSNLFQQPDKTGTPANKPSKESSPGPSPVEAGSVPTPALGSHLSIKSSSAAPDASIVLETAQTNLPSELTTTDSSSSNLSAAEPCNTPDAPVGDVLNVLPQFKKSETVTSVNTILSDTRSTLKSTLTESTSSNLCSTEPTSKDTAVNSDPNRGGKTTTEAKTNGSQDHPSEPPIHVEIGNANNQCEASKESDTTDSASEKKAEKTVEENKTDAETAVTVHKTAEPSCPGKPGEDNDTETEGSLDEAIAQSPQSKQPKGSQSRYHSSTAGVLASSNLRDDTKLLLEQISVNSQSRTEPTKEPAVTDDEKEDDKSVSGERGLRFLSRAPHQTQQEREKLLEKLQNMRKERKVYSRFEMAP